MSRRREERIEEFVVNGVKLFKFNRNALNKYRTTFKGRTHTSTLEARKLITRNIMLGTITKTEMVNGSLLTVTRYGSMRIVHVDGFVIGVSLIDNNKKPFTIDKVKKKELNKLLGI